MKYECEVVRDLMPLYVDGTASERSRTMVDEHTEECEPCREMLEEMRQEVIPEPPKEEATGLVQKLRRKRSKRVVLLVLLGVALTLLLAAIGLRVWTYFYNDFTVMTPFDEYSLELDDEEGVHVILKMENGQQQLLNFYFDEETRELYIWSTTARMPRKTDMTWRVFSSGMYYHPDYGYALGYWGGYRWVSRVYKGAPDFWYGEGQTQEHEVLAEGIEERDEEAAKEWLETLRNPERIVYRPHMEE